MAFSAVAQMAPREIDLSAQQPENEGKHQADENARRDRHIEGKIAALDPNVAGKSAKPQPRKPWPEKADCRNRQSDDDQDAGHLCSAMFRPRGNRLRPTDIVGIAADKVSRKPSTAASAAAVPRDSLIEPRLYFFHWHKLFIRAFDSSDLFVFLLRQFPSVFEGFLLSRPFARQHFVLQIVVDIANMPSHICVPRFIRKDYSE
jgi:hypothetical protein